MGMGKFRRRWIVNILRMQVVIVCAFFLICGITPLAVIADYVDDVSRTSLRTMDESMLESLRYAQQTIRFLAQSDGVSAQAAAYLDETGSTQARQKAQVELRRHLLSAEYNNPEFEVVALIAPGTILTNLNVSGTIYNLDHSNQTLNEMFARDAFREYLEEQGYSGVPEESMIFERVSDRAFFAALLDYSSFYSGVEEGVFAVNEAGDSILFDSSAPLAAFVKDNGDSLFGSSDFGVRRYGLDLFRNLHVIDGRLYFHSEYCALESGVRYIQLQEMDGAVRSAAWAALRCAALCALLEVAILAALAPMTRRVLTPFAQLSESARQMTGGDEGVQQINRLMRALRRRRTILTQVFGVYALTLVPVIAMLPVSVAWLGGPVMVEARGAYVDSVQQTAQMISNRIQLSRRQCTALVVNTALHDLILAAPEQPRTQSDAELENLMLSQGMFMRDIQGAVLYGADGGVLANSRGYDGYGALDGSIRQLLAGKYRLSTMVTDPYGSDGMVTVYAVRSTRVQGSYSLFDTMGYLLVESDPVMDFEVDQDDESYFYLYSGDAWAFVETPDYLPFRRALEGMAQGSLIDIGLPVDSRIFQIDRAMLQRESYLPGFTQGEGGNQLLVVSAQVEPAELVLIAATSMLPISEVGRLLPAILIVTSLAFGCAMLLVAMLFAKKLVRRVRDVERYLESADLQHYELPEEIDAGNEIGALARSMRDAIARIDRLKQEIVEEQAKQNRLETRKREAEVVALQSQMDSHLISNVFATMKLLQLEGDADTLRRMIDATGNFLRSGLVHNEYDVPLSRELRHVEAYLEIQSIRFGEKLNVEWTPCDPGLLRCRVPKYLLQPVFENAIKHGMRPKARLTIRVRIARQDGRLAIRVANDGYGLTPEAVAELNLRLERREAADHIGLSNVQERIALRYGSPFGLTLHSEGADGWTWVDIALPAEMEEETDV